VAIDAEIGRQRNDFRRHASAAGDEASKKR
jgi:hypothetical protein